MTLFSSGNIWLPTGPTQAAVTAKFTGGNPERNECTRLCSSCRARSAWSSVRRRGNAQVPPSPRMAFRPAPPERFPNTVRLQRLGSTDACVHLAGRCYSAEAPAAPSSHEGFISGL